MQSFGRRKIDPNTPYGGNEHLTAWQLADVANAIRLHLQNDSNAMDQTCIAIAAGMTLNEKITILENADTLKFGKRNREWSDHS